MTNLQALSDSETYIRPNLALVALVLLAGLTIFTFAAVFVANLVKGAQQLHQRGALRHPWLVVAATLACPIFAIRFDNSPLVPYALIVGLGVGYAVMLWAGTGWFRWTVAPSAAIIMLTLAGAR